MDEQTEKKPLSRNAQARKLLIDYLNEHHSEMTAEEIVDMILDFFRIVV